jgi:hypothetical protein
VTAELNAAIDVLAVRRQRLELHVQFEIRITLDRAEVFACRNALAPAPTDDDAILYPPALGGSFPAIECLSQRHEAACIPAC